MASRPSSSTGSTHGGGREAAAARVVEFTPRGGGAPAANDNARPTGRRLIRVLGPALLGALAASSWAYLYLS